MSDKPLAIWDTECFPNYWLLKVMRKSDGREISFERTDVKELDREGVRRVWWTSTATGTTYPCSGSPWPAPTTPS
jgi:hypothetical protein